MRYRHSKGTVLLALIARDSQVTAAFFVLSCRLDGVPQGSVLGADTFLKSLREET